MFELLTKEDINSLNLKCNKKNKMNIEMFIVLMYFTCPNILYGLLNIKYSENDADIKSTIKLMKNMPFNFVSEPQEDFLEDFTIENSRILAKTYEEIVHEKGDSYKNLNGLCLYYVLINSNQSEIIEILENINDSNLLKNKLEILYDIQRELFLP